MTTLDYYVIIPASAALTDEEEDATHAEDDKEHLRNETEEDVEINPDTDPKKPLRDKSGKQGRDRSKISQKKSEWGDEDPSDSGDDTLGLFSPETQAKNAPYKLSISEAFEAFLIEKLFPCLEVQPGEVDSFYRTVSCEIDINLNYSINFNSLNITRQESTNGAKPTAPTSRHV